MIRDLAIAAVVWLGLACIAGPVIGRRLRRNNQTTKGDR